MFCRVSARILFEAVLRSRVKLFHQRLGLVKNVRKCPADSSQDTFLDVMALAEGVIRRNASRVLG